MGADIPWLARGRCSLSVDVCLFNAKRDEEARVEFGVYTLAKLKNDARKLAIDLSAPENHSVTNFAMLWRTRESGVVASDRSWRDSCLADAVTASNSRYAVKMEVASEQDMFVAGSNSKRKVQVALFSVLPSKRADVDAIYEFEHSVDLPL